jgi:hypothetical protein
MPPHKLHKNCDCYLTKVKSADVKTSAFAECDLRKFTEYIFTDSKKSKGKLAIFESLGYNKNDSNILKEEYEKQALNEYLSGNYTLKDLDKNGQRLAIAISLKGKRFFTGWMIEPEGKIRATTPFGGWVND